MADHLQSHLVNESGWRFDEIARGDPERASKLAGSGSAIELLKGLEDALSLAAGCSDVRIG